MKELTQFEPTIEKLHSLVAESAGIKEVNLDDPTQLESVKKARLKLRDARVSIEKTGKAYREDALAYQRAVIAKEKELIAIIEPEEQRLKMFEKSAEIQKEKRLRVAQLPERRARLEKEGFPVNESILLEMDSVAFETHFNGLVAEKNRKATEAIEQKEREQKAESERIRNERNEGRRQRLLALGFTHSAAGSMQFVIGKVPHITITAGDIDAPEEIFEKQISEFGPVIEQKKSEAAKKAEDDRKAEEERVRKEERERIEREAKEKAEKEAAEKAEIEKQKKYKKFLADNGYTPETAQDFKEEHTPEGVILWKRLSFFKK